MALYIPKLGKSGIQSEHKPGEEQGLSPRHGGVSWDDRSIRDFYGRLQSGTFGNHKEHQIKGIQKIIDEARGADGQLEPSRVLRAINQLQKKRVDLEIDSATMEGMVSHLSQGPAD